MIKAIEWWKSLTPFRQKYLAEREQWTTPDRLSEEQIEMIYSLEDNY